MPLCSFQPAGICRLGHIQQTAPCLVPPRGNRQKSISLLPCKTLKKKPKTETPAPRFVSSPATRLYKAMAPLRFSRTWSIPWKPQNTRNAWQDGLSAKCFVSVPGADTYAVYDDGGKDGPGDGLAIGRVVSAADKLFVAGAEEYAEDGEDDDGEH